MQQRLILKASHKISNSKSIFLLQNNFIWSGPALHHTSGCLIYHLDTRLFSLFAFDLLALDLHQFTQFVLEVFLGKWFKHLDLRGIQNKFVCDYCQLCSGLRRRRTHLMHFEDIFLARVICHIISNVFNACFYQFSA